MHSPGVRELPLELRDLLVLAPHLVDHLLLIERPLERAVLRLQLAGPVLPLVAVLGHLLQLLLGRSLAAKRRVALLGNVFDRPILLLDRTLELVDLHLHVDVRVVLLLQLCDLVLDRLLEPPERGEHVLPHLLPVIRVLLLHFVEQLVLVLGHRLAIGSIALRHLRSAGVQGLAIFLRGRGSKK